MPPGASGQALADFAGGTSPVELPTQFSIRARLREVDLDGNMGCGIWDIEDRRREMGCRMLVKSSRFEVGVRALAGRGGLELR
jgi:hypothetical protein